MVEKRRRRSHRQGCYGRRRVGVQPNSFEASGTVQLNSETVFVRDIPAKGYKIVKDYEARGEVQATEKVLENAFFRIELDETGAFTRLYDKRNDREVLKSGARGNVLTAYEITRAITTTGKSATTIKKNPGSFPTKRKFIPLRDGARAGVEIRKPFMNSVITQKVWLYDDGCPHRF